MQALWMQSGEEERKTLRAVGSQNSVLQACASGSSLTSETSLGWESETTSRDQTALPAPQGPPLLDVVMGSVCVAARHGAALPQSTRQLLQQLFPSARAISATVPSADGLGMAVVTLMQPQPGQRSSRDASTLPPLPPTAARQVAQPLPAGGSLSFGLAVHPPAIERQLMEAFAAELGSRLTGGSLEAGTHPLLADAAATPGASMPHDCFWQSF
ncbi:hypothetical protein D9Q98_010307 [Chlorella vulgaris]|uniref:Uncharacterized protein n=1 Tax=Chlorella vulgaris TaxID=3077 RepID=A0A9D4TJY2_CHLVU|nr:hypothetical protein D9Q98_010307 [Chlorella vulgaris]